MTSITRTNKEITKRLTKIENALKTKLDAFYNKKIKPISYLPIESIRRKYDREVKTLIRVTVEKAYLTGTDIVSQKVTDKRKDFQLFISVTDAQNIQSLTNKMADHFWTTTGRLIRREQEFIFNNASKELEKKKGFDTTAAMIALSVSATFVPFNTAVISKTSVITGITPVTQQFVSTGQLGLELDVGFGIEELDPFNMPLEGKVMFLTQEDAKVDPEICEPLNRTVYDVNDPDLPIPIEDTHIHCRCRLVPILDEFQSLDSL